MKQLGPCYLVQTFKHVQTSLARIQIQAVSMQSYSEFPIQISDLPELKTELCGVLYEVLAGRT